MEFREKIILFGNWTLNWNVFNILLGCWRHREAYLAASQPSYEHFAFPWCTLPNNKEPSKIVGNNQFHFETELKRKRENADSSNFREIFFSLCVWVYMCLLSFDALYLLCPRFWLFYNHLDRFSVFKMAGPLAPWSHSLFLEVQDNSLFLEMVLDVGQLARVPTDPKPLGIAAYTAMKFFATSYSKRVSMTLSGAIP